MKTFKLENSRYSIDVPALTYGTASFERKDIDEHYFELLDAYMKLGGSCIDTARSYCAWVEGGEDASEGVIGRWIKLRQNRDKIILITKGGHPDREDMSISRLTRSDILSDINKSLEVLGTDYVDIFFLHRDDEKVDVSEIMPVLNELVESGKVHFIGASNWKTARIEKANKYAAEHNLEPFRVSQINYSFAHTSKDMFGDNTIVCMDLNEYSWYKRNNFPVMAFSPQAKGFFSKLANGESVKNIVEGQFVSTANLLRLANIIRHCEKTGEKPATVALGYLNSQPFPVSSVFSVTKLWQLEEDMTAQDTVYDSDTISRLEL